MSNFSRTMEGMLIPGERERWRGTAADLARQQEEIARLQRRSLGLHGEIRELAADVLRRICAGDVPMAERAAWSAAFHAACRSDEPVTPEWMMTRAELYSATLTTADNALRQPAAPMVMFTTGRRTGWARKERPFTCAYAAATGTGIAYGQEYNQSMQHHYHTATVNQLSGPATSSAGRQLLVSQMEVREFADAIVTPGEAARALGRPPEKPKVHLVLGYKAVNDLFEGLTTRGAGSTSPEAAQLLGHAMIHGFQPQF